MAAERWREVDDFLTALLAPEDDVLRAVLDANAAAGLPPHDVSPAQGKLLQILARACAARRILEVGTLGGYGAIWLARALPPEGRLVTLEADPGRAALARDNVARAGLAGVVEVRTGRAVDLLPELVAAVDEGAQPFDLVFLDADKQSNTEYLAWSLRLTRPGSLIVADNVVRDGRVLEADGTDASVQGVRRFLAALAAEPRVTATALQTVGVKGWDGFALALVVPGRSPDAGVG